VKRSRDDVVDADELMSVAVASSRRTHRVCSGGVITPTSCDGLRRSSVRACVCLIACQPVDEKSVGSL